MRTPLAIAIGVMIGIASAGAVYLAVEQSQPTAGAKDEGSSIDKLRPSPAVASRPLDAPQTATPARPSPALPVTPVYGPAPGATRPIYRCTSRSGVEYSNEPCAGGTVVAEAESGEGYDSRPSDRLARLVTEGRTADSTPPVPYRSNSPLPRESVECANLRRQVADIDASMLRPNYQRTLDEWRRIRQDIRTSMARNHC